MVLCTMALALHLEQVQLLVRWNMMRMSERFRSTFSVVCPATGLSKWMKNLFLRLLLLYAVPDVKVAVMRLFEDDPEGYTKRLDIH